MQSPPGAAHTESSLCSGVSTLMVVTEASQQMSSELSLSCQAHTESLTTIPCSLGHHTEHPKWLELVGILQQWGHLLVMSHRALPVAKRENLVTQTVPLQTVPSVTGHHTEHARLISLKERITPSLNSFSTTFSKSVSS